MSGIITCEFCKKRREHSRFALTLCEDCEILDFTCGGITEIEYDEIVEELKKYDSKEEDKK